MLLIEVEVYITPYLYMSKFVDLGTINLIKFLDHRQKEPNPHEGLALLR